MDDLTDITCKCVVCGRPLVRKGRFCNRTLCKNVKSSFHRYRKEGTDEDIALMLALETTSAVIAASGGR